VRSPDSPPFGDADDRLLSALASQLGLAVERKALQHAATENEILKRTDELKSALINAVSHDLRTPLASIIASGASLRRSDVDWTKKERQELGAVVEEEALRLDRIVGNLLDLSRLEGGALKLEKDVYDLAALVDDVLSRLGARAARHTLGVDVPDDLPPVLLDYVAIDQVLSNLVENAAKHTPPGSEIEVSARARDGEVQVTVADNGPGIPPEALPRLFEPFYRVDMPGRAAQGTGLGLTVAKGLVEAHGGRIWAENRPEGGARFVFTLPLGVPDAAPDTVGGRANAQGAAAAPGEVER
jgi:two-component system sensor histidine kinase KdpD